MAEIGETLRETRMRARIDIGEVETATKIRAKYLRALENEEWDLLPGPTFVKTFLRTYAEYLNLDPKRLVEEYRQRFERSSAQEFASLAPLGGARDRRSSRVGPSPAMVVGAAVVVLVGVLFLIGKVWPTGDDARTPNTVTSPVAQASPTPTRKRRSGHAAPARPVRLQITATALVNVCLLDASGRRVIDSRNLSGGEATPTYRSRRFRVAFGNNQLRLRVNGKRIRVPARSRPIGYELRAGRAPRELSLSAQPRCT